MAAQTGGFRVPAEDAPHQRTFMQWPVSRAVYNDRGFLAVIQSTIANIANAISAFEPVTLLADKKHHKAARTQLSSDVELCNIPTEDLWCRDSGPIFMTNAAGDIAISHIQFNGWGARQVHTHDAQIAARLAQRLGIPIFDTGLIGEGGAVEQDGYGTLLAHASSWVNDNRNPGLSRAQIEQQLKAAYGAKRVIWAEGLAGQDITDYHIDSLARFTAPGRVLMNLPYAPDLSDPFHAAAVQTHDALINAGLDVEVIPEPQIRRVSSIDFLASYANYYICNGAVIAAQFGDEETDARAHAALKKHYPDREIVALNVDALGECGGGIHCATQQMPAV
ncbi:MAG: agmatine deiminase family protein [Pseudomonadota bacterium]